MPQEGAWVWRLDRLELSRRQPNLIQFSETYDDCLGIDLGLLHVVPLATSITHDQGLIPQDQGLIPQP